MSLALILDSFSREIIIFSADGTVLFLFLIEAKYTVESAVQQIFDGLPICRVRSERISLRFGRVFVLILESILQVKNINSTLSVSAFHIAPAVAVCQNSNKKK